MNEKRKKTGLIVNSKSIRLVLFLMVFVFGINVSLANSSVESLMFKEDANINIFIYKIIRNKLYPESEVKTKGVSRSNLGIVWLKGGKNEK